MASFAEIGGFDANKVAPNEFGAIEAGDYEAVITESSWESTKSGKGKFLKLKLQILSGRYQNRVLFDRLNLINDSAMAVQIANGTLSAICRAVGVMTPKGSEELHNKPLKVTVRVKKDDQGNPANEIAGYKSRHVGAPTPPTPQPATQQTQAAHATAAATPW